MKKLSEKSRRLCRRALRMFYRGVGAAVAFFLFPACNLFGPREPYAMYGMPGAYGMPDPPPYQQEYLVINGCVSSKKTGEPVSGIGIWIIRNTIPYDSILTDTDGQFNFSMQKNNTAAIAIVFTDIDGGENGGLFKTHTVNLTVEECEALTEPLNIELEELEEADE